jgi:hypothetical protein
MIKGQAEKACYITYNKLQKSVIKTFFLVEAKRKFLFSSIFVFFVFLVIVLRTLFYFNCFTSRGRIFSHVRPFYERAVSDLDRSMHRSLWV